MRRGRKGLSRSNRNGPRGGENKWVSRSWPEPTLPQKPREGWGNLVRNLDSERMGQPPSAYVVFLAPGGPHALVLRIFLSRGVDRFCSLLADQSCGYQSYAASRARRLARPPRLHLPDRHRFT